jgi:hypothetical protein
MMNEDTHEQNTGSGMQTFGKKISVAPVDRTGRGKSSARFINK